MKKIRICLIVLSTSFLGALSLLQLGCDIQSGDEVVRNVSISVTGVYRNSAGIPERQTGNRVTSFNLSQSGDQLFALDNNGGRWTGNIGVASDSQASFTLKGETSEGTRVVITGTIVVNGNSATMTGTWVEPGLTATVFAEGEVVPTPTATPGATATSSTSIATATATSVAISATPTATISGPPLPG